MLGGQRIYGQSLCSSRISAWPPLAATGLRWGLDLGD